MTTRGIIILVVVLIFVFVYLAMNPGGDLPTSQYDPTY